MKIKNQDFLKRENQSLVLELILDQGPISRAEIAKQTTMSPTSASRIVTSLLDENLIKEVNKPISEAGVGRKAVYFIPNESSVVSIGVELDLNCIRIAVCNFIGDILIDRSFHYKTESPLEVVHFLEKTIEQLIEKIQVDQEQIIGVCVGLPGLINYKTGVVKLSAQLNWKEVPFKEMLQKVMPYQIQVENELKLKALAEYEATNYEYEDIAIVGFGNGVGSALISKGEIYRGEGNYSGEIGHTTLDPYGTYCTCGSFGCLQTYIAVDFLLEEALKQKQVDSLEDLVTEYRNGEKWAGKIFDKASTYAAIAINNVVCTYNPEAIILAGSLIEDYIDTRQLIVEKAKEYVWPLLSDSFDLNITKTKDKGVVMGAALSSQRHFIKNIKF